MVYVTNSLCMMLRDCVDEHVKEVKLLPSDVALNESVMAGQMYQ